MRVEQTVLVRLEPSLERLELPSAGFWLRLGAFVIDSAVLFSMNVFVLYSSGLRLGLQARLGSMALSTLYFGLTTGAWGQTFGKMLAGVAVVRDEDDGPIGFSRAFARSLAHFISGVVLGTGYLVAAFTPRKRALHDFMAGTRVVIPEPISTARKGAVIVTGVLGACGFILLSGALLWLLLHGAREVKEHPVNLDPTPSLDASPLEG